MVRSYGDTEYIWKMEKCIHLQTRYILQLQKLLLPYTHYNILYSTYFCMSTNTTIEFLLKGQNTTNGWKINRLLGAWKMSGQRSERKKEGKKHCAFRSGIDAHTQSMGTRGEIVDVCGCSPFCKRQFI